MNTSIRLIKTESDYKDALMRVNSLMDAQSTQLVTDELEVLATLIELYEDEHFPIGKPNPIEAIKFRMEQMDLTNRDLIPLIGSRSKVSEILSGKCNLTLKMIRALNKNLKIPAEVLLQETYNALPNDMNDIDWEKFPLATMAKFGWIKKILNLKDHAEEIMRDFINQAGGIKVLPSAFFRKNDSSRQNAKMNKYALTAWCLQVLILARKVSIPPYQKASVNLDFIKYVAKLSSFAEGPKLAKEYLEKHGIHLIYVPHLPNTYLDGVVLQLDNGSPVIGLTLRYDRIDNFWFCLCHELAHIGRHIKDREDVVFIDDITSQDFYYEDNKIENEANEWAQNATIPDPDKFNRLLNGPQTSKKILNLAIEMQIHPAIIAGRIRHELKNFRLLSNFVGHGEVRRYFKTENG